MCLVALFAITFAATKIRVGSARYIEDKNAQAMQYWEARSGAATVEASLITDVPSIFDAEMLRAQTAVGGYPLPAFDPPQITPNYSRPVLNPDGSISKYQIDSAVGEQGNARGRVRPSGTIMLGLLL